MTPSGPTPRDPTARSIALIWAEAHDRVIGAAGGMPWHVPEDLAHFKQLTAGGTVIMGRKTWDALDPRFRPLPGRRNIVITRDPAWTAQGAEVAHSVDAALEATTVPAATVPAATVPAATVPAAAAPAATVPRTIWVIGGAELFAATIDRADRLEVTELDLDVEGDTWAPPIGPGWRLVEEGDWQPSSSGLRFRFLRYVRPA